MPVRLAGDGAAGHNFGRWGVKRNRIILLSAFFLAAFELLSGAAWGQTSASLRGTVTDQSGAVISGAKVTLTNTGTGIARTTMTATDGGYLFDLVHVGTYKLGVEKAGFTTFVQAGIILEINQNARLDLALKVGEATQTVEVRSNVAQVDTTGAVLGKVEDQRMINDLPLVDRDTLQLGLLQAGVFAPDPDDGSGNPFSVGGQRSESLTFLLDGANNTDFLGNNIVVSPNPDAVQEFRILTNNYDAEYGRTSGGVVNQITKSGTNSFHGDLFEFLRNDLFNARDYFLPQGVPKQAFKRNEFGGTLGGPVKKDKLFFFVAYQGKRSHEGQTSPELTVPDVAERGGNFGEYCAAYDASGNCMAGQGTQLINPLTGANIPYNNMATAGLVSPVIQNYINKYVPLPNVGNNGFVAAPTAVIDEDQGILHLDYSLSSSDSISFAYLVDDTRDDYPYQIINGASTGGDVPLGSGFTDAFRNQIGSFTWTHTLSGSRINEFRFSANRVATLQAVPTDNTSPATLGFTNLNPDDPKGVAPPIIFTPNFVLGANPQGPTKLHSATFEWADNFTWIRGKHEFKFGVDINRVRQNYHYDFNNNGNFDFDSYAVFTGDPLADFVGGFWDGFSQYSHATYGIRTGQFAGYAQDKWKILPRLTFSYGLRYEFFVPQSDVHNEILGWFPGKQSVRFPTAPLGILYPGDPGTPNNALVYPDYKNFAPRLGLAWDVLGNAKLVMRTGAGIFYDLEDGALNLQFGGEPPFGAISNIYPSSYGSQTPGTDPIADPFTQNGYTNPFPFTPNGTFPIPEIGLAYTTYPQFRTPYSEDVNFGIQWQATPDMLVEADYVGSFGRRLIADGETNYPVPSVEQQQLTNFGSVNIECARPLAACVDFIGGPILSGPQSDPNAFPTGAQQLFTDFNSANSSSNQFQFTVDKRFGQSFALRAAYTNSKTIDDQSGFRSRSSIYTDPLDHALDRGLADFDTPQRLVISGFWQLPFDKPFGDNAIMKKIAGGWQFTGIASYQKGNPIDLRSNSNSGLQNNGLGRPDLIAPIQYMNPRQLSSIPAASADCVSSSGANVTGTFWFNPASFDCNVAPFTFGTYTRNSMRGPGINNYDLSIMKRTNFTESKYIEFRAELFNAFNHAQFLNPDYQGGDGTFGQITTDRGPRLVQFGLKLYF